MTIPEKIKDRLDPAPTRVDGPAVPEPAPAPIEPEAPKADPRARTSYYGGVRRMSKLSALSLIKRGLAGDEVIGQVDAEHRPAVREALRQHQEGQA